MSRTIKTGSPEWLWASKKLLGALPCSRFYGGCQVVGKEDQTQAFQAFGFGAQDINLGRKGGGRLTKDLEPDWRTSAYLPAPPLILGMSTLHTPVSDPRSQLPVRQHLLFLEDYRGISLHFFLESTHIYRALTHVSSPYFENQGLQYLVKL